MRDFTIDEIKTICETSAMELGIPFIDNRLNEYQILYQGRYRYYSVFRNIAASLKPSVVIEVGTWQGISAASFAAGNPTCTVITIDHHSDPGDDKNKMRTLETIDNFHNIKYFQGCSTEKVRAEKTGTICVYDDIIKFLEGRKIDVLFIDGWHSGDMARADYDTYAPFMSKPGLIICDDLTGGDSSGHIGMLKFWNDLPGQERYLDGNIHAGYPMGFLKNA
jgi:cephalosporin hydroxylase